MKKGNDVKKVVEQLKFDAELKDDFIVPLKSIEIDAGNPYPQMFFTHKEKGDTVADGIETQMTDHSVSQLCHKLEIGTSYIRKCLPFPELVETNLNHWIKNTKNKT